MTMIPRHRDSNNISPNEDPTTGERALDANNNDPNIYNNDPNNNGPSPRLINRQTLPFKSSHKSPMDLNLHPRIVAMREELEVKESKLMDVMEQSQRMQQNFDEAYELGKRHMIGPTIIKQAKVPRASEILGTLLEDEEEEYKQEEDCKEGNYGERIGKLLEEATHVQRRNRELLTENLYVLKEIQIYVHK